MRDRLGGIRCLRDSGAGLCGRTRGSLRRHDFLDQIAVQQRGRDVARRQLLVHLLRPSHDLHQYSWLDPVDALSSLFWYSLAPAPPVFLIKFVLVVVGVVGLLCLLVPLVLFALAAHDHCILSENSFALYLCLAEVAKVADEPRDHLTDREFAYQCGG